MDDYKVIIVDDDPTMCELLLHVSNKCNYKGVSVSTERQFVKAYEFDEPDLVIMDLYLGETDGIELLRYLADKQSQSQIIIISGYDEKILSVAKRLGKSHGLKIVESLQKPVRVEELITVLQQIKKNNEVPTMEELNKAIENNEIILHYQPKVDLASMQVIGVEALARWDRGSNKIVMPDKFILQAETCNLINKMTAKIVETAFKAYNELIETKRDMILSINLSGKDIDDLDLPNRFSAMAKKYKVNPEQICFEVTETAVMSRPKNVMEVLTRLRLKGFTLSIDDFGTGYSSLVVLSKMPLNEMKIDRSFIFDLNNDKDDQIITKSIIELGHNLGLKITAEGVESIDTLNLLNEYHCDIGQGYYFSAPMAKDRVIDWIVNF